MAIPYVHNAFHANKLHNTLRSKCAPTNRMVHCQANVSFTVKKKTGYGDNIRIVGDHDSLGKWKAEKGAKLSWQEGDVWTADLELPDDVTINYKVVNYRRRGKPLWEKGDNRSLAVGNTDVTVLMRWDNTQNGSVTYAERSFADEDIVSQQKIGLEASNTDDTPSNCPSMSDILRTYAVNATVDV